MATSIHDPFLCKITPDSELHDSQPSKSIVIGRHIIVMAGRRLPKLQLVTPRAKRTTPSAEPSSYLLEPDEVCSRTQCSRCHRQVRDEAAFLRAGNKSTAYTVAEATRLCEELSRNVLALWEQLRSHTAQSLVIWQEMPKEASQHIIRSWMHGMPRRADAYSWKNSTEIAHQRLSCVFGNLVLDDVLDDPGILLEFARQRSLYHPATFIRGLNTAVQRDWEIGSLAIHSARCLVRLDESGYGKVHPVSKGSLHEDGVFTFMKGYVLLAGQYNLYAALHDMFVTIGVNFINDIDSAVPGMRSCILYASREDTAPAATASSVLPMESALEKARSALKPAVKTLENMVIETIQSSENLFRDYVDFSAWGATLPLCCHHACNSAIRSEAWSDISFRRLFDISLLLALDKDITRLQRTARRHSKRKATKVSLLEDWESVERSIAVLLKYIGTLLFSKCQFNKTRDEFRLSDIDAETDSDGRNVIKPHHRLTWSIMSLGQHIYSVKSRLRQFLEYIDTRRGEKTMFHWSADWMVDLCRGLQHLVIALETLQPVGVGYYVVGGPPYGGNVHQLLSELDNEETGIYQSDQWLKRTWTPFRLNKRDGFRRHHAAIWDTIFSCVENDWRRCKITETIISGVLALHTAHVQPYNHNRRLSEGTSTGVETKPPQKPGHGNIPAANKVASSALVPPGKDSETVGLDSLVDGRPRKGNQLHGIQPQEGSGQVTAVPAPIGNHNPKNQDTRDNSSGLAKDASNPAFREHKSLAPRTEGMTNAIQQSLQAIGLGNATPKPSQWPEDEVTAQRKDKQKTRKATCPSESTDCDSEAAAEHAQPQTTSRLAFTDHKTYQALRLIFPSPMDGQHRVRLRWDDLGALLTKEPLKFRIPDSNLQILKFHREAQGGWPEGVITLHKGHAANPKMEKIQLDNLKKDLRKTFGWTADDFEFVG